MSLKNKIQNRLKEGMSSEEVRMRAASVRKELATPHGKAMNLSMELEEFSKLVSGKLKKQSKDLSNALYDYFLENENK